MSDQRWKSVRGRVSSWIARAWRAEAEPPRPRIRFGPDSALTSSPARWWIDEPPRPRSMHPSYDRLPRDRESEYERLRDEIARLAHSDEFPPVA